VPTFHRLGEGIRVRNDKKVPQVAKKCSKYHVKNRMSDLVEKHEMVKVMLYLSITINPHHFVRGGSYVRKSKINCHERI
jgi:hypothetical protein